MVFEDFATKMNQSLYFLLIFRLTSILNYRTNDSTGVPHTMKTNAGLQEFLYDLPLFLYSIAILLHLLGLFLLSNQKQSSNQDIIIMNLSVAELGMCMFDIVQNILSRLPQHDLNNNIIIVAGCGFFVIPFLIIVTFLTLDRFFEVYLNIKYQIHFNKFKIGAILALAWITGIITAVTLLYKKLRYHVNVRTLIYKYMFPTLETTLFIICVLVYGYIYYKYRKSKKPKHSTSHFRSRPMFSNSKIYPLQKNSHKRKYSTVFKKRKFFAPFLIIVTLILFVIVPDMLNLYLFYIYEKTDCKAWSNILLSLYSAGFIVDAVIYVFIQNHVRRTFFKLFCKKQPRNSIQSQTSRTSDAENRSNASK